MVNKRFLTIIIFFSVFLTFGQDWKVKLQEARKSYQSGDFSESYQQYLEAQKVAPNVVDFSNEIGQAAYKSGNFDKSIEHFNSFTENNKNKKVSSNDYHNLGNSQMKAKKYQEAIESYKKALRKNPTDQETRYNLSEALRKNAQNDQKKQDNNPPPPNSDKKKKPEQPKENKNSNTGNLPKRAVDRMLDKLSKNEADTKRKINNQNNKDQGSSGSGKDW
jgi:tetratricopeptide (TPR) repeat protein